MSRVCYFTGVGTITGNRLRYRGRAKYLGGIGKKVTSCTRRIFRPNIQRVNAVINGRPKRIKASTQAIRRGLVIKPLRRKYAYSRAEGQDA